MTGSMTVLDPGVLSLVQDEGRPGLTALAVSPSGAADLPAYRLANRIVGNRSGVAALETVLGSLRVVFDQPTVVAATGAPVVVTVDGRNYATGQAIHVDGGAELSLGRPESGLRTYLAVRGGIDLPPVLGSRSTDTLSGLGPPPLRAGDRLVLGDEIESLPAPDAVPTHSIESSPVIAITPGPRLDWLDDESRERLVSEYFTVTDQINRIGVRATGPRLTRSVHRELPSEALLQGAVQVPPNGEPIIFGPDHPTTGGYPVAAVILERMLPVVAQLRPGQTFRFRWTQL